MLQPNNRWLEPIASELTGQFVKGQVSILPEGPLRTLLEQLDTRNALKLEGRLEFERLLSKDFVPKIPGKPSRFGFSGGVPRLRGVGTAVADDALGWLVLWAALVDETEKWSEKKAKELGLTLEQWRQMKDDAVIIGILAKVAEQTLTDAELDLAKARRRRRTNVKRTRIHGYSRRMP